MFFSCTQPIAAHRWFSPENRRKTRAFLVCAFLALLGFASAADAAVLRLNWADNSSNEKGFEIWRKTGTNGTYGPVAASASNTTSYVDTTVTAGVDYCYQVRAYNDAGESSPSNEACATASDQPVSSAGAGDSGGGGGGCFIATAAFGSPMAPQVQVLREVRDKYLLTNGPGRVAVEAYYAVSPPIADVISRSETLRAAVRFGLLPVLGWASLILWSPGFGASVPLLSVAVGGWLIRRRSRLG